MLQIKFFTWFLVAALMIIILVQYIKIKKMRHEINVMHKIRETLYSLGEMVSKARTEEEVYTQILNSAINLIPSASKGSILMLENDGKFHYKTLKGYSDELKKLTLNREEAFLHKINNFSETAIVMNPAKFDEVVVMEKNINVLKNIEALEIYCVISSPIYIDGKLVGLINIDSVNKNKVFTKEDIGLMNHIKNELQLVIKNSLVQNKLRYMANYDELTGLINRRYFKQILNMETENIRSLRAEGCLVLIDLDDFKNINDNYGHNTGDRALKFFADVLRENIRKTDVYARMSGDEFVILFRNCSRKNAIETMERIKQALSERSMEGIYISFSYGICGINNEDGYSCDEIFGIADKIMYADKRDKGVRRR